MSGDQTSVGSDADPRSGASDPSPEVSGDRPGAHVAPGAPAGVAPEGASPTTAEGSGDPRVDDAVSRLTELSGLPVAEQVEVYADIHRRLAAVLSDPDSQAQ